MPRCRATEWSCCSAPIYNENTLVGILNISINVENHHLHTIGMVEAAAYAVSEQLRLRLLLKEQNAMLEFLDEGVLILDGEGRIRAIGITSFGNERVQDLFLHNEVKPAVNQLETHPFFQQQEANAFLRQEGIQHEAWAPFAEGKNGIFHHPVLKAIAEHHGKTVASVILRWLNQRGIVVIPKSVRKERMIENLNIFDFTLTDEEMQAIAGLDTGKSPIYDDTDLPTVRGIGLHKIHD